MILAHWFKKNPILISIVLVGFFIRIVAIYPGYPPTHPDEPLTHGKAVQMIVSGDLDPHKYDYPILPMHLHAIFYFVLFLPVTLIIKLFSNPISVIENVGLFHPYLIAIINTHALYWGRILTVMLSIVSIYSTFILGKKIFNKTTGLVAAFLVAVNFRHVSSSILSLNDIPNTLMTLVSFILFMSLLEKQSTKKYIVLGIVLGMSLSVKYQTFILIPFIATQIIIGYFSRGTQLERIKKIVSRDFIFCILLIGITFFILNIFPILHFQEWKHWLSDVSARYGIGITGFNTYPLWFLFTIGLGNILSGFVIFGFVLALIQKEHRKKTMISLSLIVFIFYFYFYYIQGGIYTRNFTSFIPLLIIFGSFGITKIVDIVLKPRFKLYRVLMFMMLLSVVAYPTIKYSLLVSFYLSKETTNTCIQEWLTKNLPQNSKVGILPPILPTDPFVIKNAKTVDVSMKSGYHLASLQENNIEYLVMNISTHLAYTIKWIYQGTLYWDMPVHIIDNTLEGLTIQELAPFAVKECIKPWPVFDDNYIVYKIPQKKEQSNKKFIAGFSFENENKNKTQMNIVPANSSIRKLQIIHDNSCEKESCAKFALNSYEIIKRPFPSYQPSGAWLFYPPRLQSNIIPIKPGNVYQATVLIRSDKTIHQEEKDGFLRLDFYNNKADIVKDKPIATYLSIRLWGNPNWKSLDAIGYAYKDAHYLTVSIQSEDIKNNFFIQKFSVFEVEKSFLNIPQYKTVDRRIFYPSFIL